MAEEGRDEVAGAGVVIWTFFFPVYLVGNEVRDGGWLTVGRYFCVFVIC